MVWDIQDIKNIYILLHGVSALKIYAYTIYWFVTMVYYYNNINLGHYP
jgi:hypothetical protein